jgi:3-hydroxyacyl-CoA dehydrogenase
MNFTINRVVVVGSGTMGGGIAAHFANAGIPVYLLDVAPNSLTSEEKQKGLRLEDSEVKNRLVKQNFERLLKSKPPAFFLPENADLITIGNLADNENWLGEGDWIIEAIVEQLSAKRDLMKKIEKWHRPGMIVSSNTSGIPIHEIAAESPAHLKAHFIGTHFFNPPRYMKLLEIIPTADTAPEITDFVVRFGEERLGKGIVICKDTPNFIANRYYSVTSSPLMNYAIKNDYTVEETDAIAGQMVGRPKTALFRLFDLVGLDVGKFVNANLYHLIPGDESREDLRGKELADLMEKMIEANRLGDKTGSGFYQKPSRGTNGAILSLDLKTLEYRSRLEPNLPTLFEAAKIKSLPERLKFLLAQNDKAGEFTRQIIYGSLSYAARRVPEISDNLVNIDRAVRWGFAHDAGPFEIWDSLGVRQIAKAMCNDNFAVPDWVEEMLDQGFESFYHDSNGILEYYDLLTKKYVAEKTDERRLDLRLRKKSSGVVQTNKSASLVDLGDGVLGLEFHSKLNTLDDENVLLMHKAVEEVEKNWVGLVIGNQGADFSVGANLANIALLIEKKDFTKIESGVTAMQQFLQGFRFCRKPVVTAPAGRTLGGGAETVLAGAGIVAAAETFMGLVEIGAGLIPGAGGCKEMVRRVVSLPFKEQSEKGDVVLLLQKIMETIGTAKISGNAFEARQMGFLTVADKIVMNRDFQLATAKKEVLEMVKAGFVPPPDKPNCYAAGREALAILKSNLHFLERAGRITQYDLYLAEKLAFVICGGDLIKGQWMNEQYFLDLERETFVSLCGEPKTFDRMQNILRSGKPLRN